MKKGFIDIEVSKLIKAEWNYKKENEELSKKLLANFKEYGQVENIQVRKLGDKYEVVNGNHVWFPDTAGTIATGVTTSTTGSAVFEFKLPVESYFANADAYLFFKINGSGNITIDYSQIVWSE